MHLNIHWADMEMDVYRWTLIQEQSEFRLEFVGTVDGDNLTHCQRLAWAEYFARNGEWFLQSARLFPQGVIPKRQGKPIDPETLGEFGLLGDNCEPGFFDAMPEEVAHWPTLIAEVVRPGILAWPRPRHRTSVGWDD